MFAFDGSPPLLWRGSFLPSAIQKTGTTAPPPIFLKITYANGMKPADSQTAGFYSSWKNMEIRHVLDLQDPAGSFPEG